MSVAQGYSGYTFSLNSPEAETPMKQLQTTGAGTPLAWVEGPTPEPTGAEVLLRTVACGVCHSDVHLHDGVFDLGGGKALPVAREGMTLGHEIIGEVVALGPEAEGVALGDLRVAYPWIGCGACATCRRGDEQLCLAPANLGIQKAGGFGDHVVVPHSRYLFDPGTTDPKLAATYACSGLTTYAALKRVPKLLEGDHLVLVGAGGLGMMALAIAQAAFGITPIMVDVDDDKLDAAKAAGAAEAVNATDADAAKTLKGLTGGGALAVIDFVGSEPSSALALASLRKGGKLIVVGMYGGELRFPLPFLPMQARTIEGNYVGSLQDMDELMTLVREGRIPPVAIDSRQPEEAGAILAGLKAGQIRGRAVLSYKG